MTEDRFRELIEHFEQEARARPGAYRRRVLLLAMLGNAYFAAAVLLIAALFAAALASIAFLKAIGVKLAIVVGVLLWIVLRALWVRIPPPEGVPVTAREAPELFAMIDEIRRVLRAPRFHRALLTGDFNAAVAQRPRLGILGWYRNHLLIGLPLLKTLTVDQFKAVLAHEFGHLAGGHGRVATWIYRQRLRWARLMVILEANSSKGSILFRPFLAWYAPYFNACSFPLARANEYEADAISARLTSPASAAQALTSVSVVGGYLDERYWPHIHRQADDLPEPKFAPYSALARDVGAQLDPASAQAWLDRAMAQQTSLADTHPALADRLQAIGEAPQFVPAQPGATADRLLGASLGRLTELMDRRWHEQILPAWRVRYVRVQQGRMRLDELNARHESGAALSRNDGLERATLTESVGGDPESGFAQLRRMLAAAPDDALLCLAVGARLVARDDAEGVALIERAMELNEDAVLEGAQLLRDYHWRQGQQEAARAWHERAAESAHIEQGIKEERSRISLSDTFEDHGLPNATVGELRTQLQAIAGLRAAYLVRKRVSKRPDRPCYVLGFTVGGTFRLHSKARAAEVQARILDSVPLPEGTVVFNAEGDNRRFQRRFRRMRGARVV